MRLIGMKAPFTFRVYWILAFQLDRGSMKSHIFITGASGNIGAEVLGLLLPMGQT